MNKIFNKKNSYWIFEKYYKIFLIPESMVAFISGIFISVSTGIVTCAVPNSLLSIGCNYIISSIFMFVASIAMMIWSICIKPIQDLFYNDSILGPRGKNNFYDFIHDQNENGVIKKVNVCLFIALSSIIISIILWVTA